MKINFYFFIDPILLFLDCLVIFFIFTAESIFYELFGFKILLLVLVRSGSICKCGVQVQVQQRTFLMFNSGLVCIMLFV